VAFSFATLTHSFVNADGSPASGSVEFTLQQTMTNGSVTMVASTHITAALDASGNMSQVLTSTLDPGTFCQGLAVWRADERVAGAPVRSLSFAVPSGGVSVDYGALIQTPPAWG
jgi:hypothetical protein